MHSDNWHLSPVLPGKRYCLSASRKDPNIKERSLGNSLSEQDMHPLMSFLDVVGLSLNRWVWDRTLGAVEDYAKTKAMEEEFQPPLLIYKELIK